jgi:hypothetical protein
MKLHNPNDPFPVNLNGKTVDAGHGLVNAQNQPIGMKKGDALAHNRKVKENQERNSKTVTINQWIQTVIEKYYPKESANVKSAKDADDLCLKKNIEIITQLGEKVDSCVIVQSQWRKPPKILGLMQWNWKK